MFPDEVQVCLESIADELEEKGETDLALQILEIARWVCDEFHPAEREGRE